MGIRTNVDAQNYDNEKRKRENENQRRMRDTTPYYYGSERTNTRGTKWLNRDQNLASPISALKIEDRSTDKPMDLSTYKGVEILNPKERELCSLLHIPPLQYCEIKELLIREDFNEGYIKKNTAYQLVKLDQSKTSKLYDFFISCGWIKSSPSSEKPEPVINKNTPNTNTTHTIITPNTINNTPMDMIHSVISNTNNNNANNTIITPMNSGYGGNTHPLSGMGKPSFYVATTTPNYANSFLNTELTSPNIVSHSQVSSPLVIVQSPLTSTTTTVS